MRDPFPGRFIRRFGAGSFSPRLGRPAVEMNVEAKSAPGFGD